MFFLFRIGKTSAGAAVKCVFPLKRSINFKFANISPIVSLIKVNSSYAQFYHMAMRSAVLLKLTIERLETRFVKKELRCPKRFYIWWCCLYHMQNEACSHKMFLTILTCKEIRYIELVLSLIFSVECCLSLGHQGENDTNNFILPLFSIGKSQNGFLFQQQSCSIVIGIPNLKHTYAVPHVVYFITFDLNWQAWCNVYIFHYLYPPCLLLPDALWLIWPVAVSVVVGL